jgi:hypothetical protein
VRMRMTSWALRLFEIPHMGCVVGIAAVLVTVLDNKFLPPVSMLCPTWGV